MKKFLYLLLGLLFVLSFTACNDDDDAVDDSITIVSSNLLFGAVADTGSLVFESESSVSVTTDSDWCTATVIGKTVTVSVTENTGLEGRATRLHLTNSSETLSVTVQQEGMRFNVGSGASVIAGDEAATLYYDVSTNLDIETMTFTKDDSDWFSDVKLTDDGQLQVTFTENSTGHYRQGEIYYGTSSFTDTLDVYQYDFDTDIAGTVIFMYNASSSGSLKALSATLDEEGLTFTYSSNEFTIPLTFVEDKMKFKLFMGQYCGMNDTYYVYTVITGGGYIGWGSTYYVELPVVFDSSVNYTTMAFTDVGAFSYGYDCVQLYNFTFDEDDEDHTLSSDARVSVMLSLYNAKLNRYNQ